eukprot:5069256-Amphidinium_carterae.1
MAASRTTVLSVNQTTGLSLSSLLQSRRAIKTGAISAYATGCLVPALSKRSSHGLAPGLRSIARAG